MLSRILILGIWAVSLAGVSIGQDTAELGSPTVAKSPLAVLAPGLYNITQAHAGNVVVYRSDGDVLVLEDTPPAVWKVENVGANYRIVSTQFKQAASAQGTKSPVVLTAPGAAAVWTISNAGESQWIIKAPNVDSVWKFSSSDPTIRLAKADGTITERWEFTPA
ncbi:hypothetical protein C8R44DRAFT_919439 [Mycena epipterygia]|nr:hypothetical protein C8R44DRAFT_919439 [Mycena epipterygia]